MKTSAFLKKYTMTIALVIVFVFFTALTGGRLQGAQPLPQFPQPSGDDAVGEKIDLFFREINRRLDVHPQFDQTLDQGVNLPGKLALQRTQGGAGGGDGVAGDQVGNRLGLD